MARPNPPLDNAGFYDKITELFGFDEDESVHWDSQREGRG